MRSYLVSLILIGLLYKGSIVNAVCQTATDSNTNPGSCDFSNGPCGYTLGPNWLLHRGTYGAGFFTKTRSIPGGHTDGSPNDQYAVFSRKSGLSEMRSPHIAAGSYCLSFWYVLTDQNVTLSVSLEPFTSVIWNHTFSSAVLQWTHVTLDVQNTHDFQVKPRKHEKKYRNYPTEVMLKAYEAVKTGVPVQRAAKQFGIPEQTLRDRVKGYVDPNNFNSGGETFFSKEEEETLVDHVETMSQLGYGYSNTQLQNLAGEMAFDLGKKSKNKALSNNWLYGFLRRWNSRLASFTPRKLESARAKCATPETISSYFCNLKDVMIKYDLLDKPQFIYNIDETGLQSEHRPTNVIAGVNSKPQAVTSPSSTTTTLIGCVNATGYSLPPYFVFKGKRFNPDLMKGKSAGAAGTVSDSGWSNAKVFRSYLTDHFLPNVRPFAGDEQHILLIFDGHASHFTPELITWAKSHNIILFVLPAYTSHLLQPLDVAIFGPFKSFYYHDYTECSNFMRNNIGQTITRYDMCEIACKAYLKSMTPLNVQSGFRKTGIYPLSEQAVSREKLFPCESFRETEPIEKIKAIKSSKEEVEKFLKLKMEKQTEKIENKQCSKCRCNEKPRPGGKAITEEQFLTSLADYDKTKEIQTTEVKRSKKSKAGSLTLNKSSSPKPSKSGIGKLIRLESEDEDSEDEEIDGNEEDLCCVCKKMSPPSLKDSLDLKIVNWAMCDNCSNWVHLAFCSTVRVVRRHSSFLCPHCEKEANMQI